MKTTGRSLALGLVYLVTGWAALGIAGPDGYATAIFPPAGIALASLLRYGNRVWPGIWVGDFLLSMLGAGSGDGAGHWSESASMASGASLQALCGSWLVRRALRDREALAEDTEIARFLILGGPVSCVVNASVATGTLLAAGQSYGEGAAVLWWSFWAGDTVGVFVGALLTLCFVGRPRAVWHERRLTVGMPLAVAIAAISAFFAQAGSWETGRFRTELEQRATALVEALKRSIAGDIEALMGLASFMASAPEVQREHFHAFLRTAMAHHPAIQALEWAPRVPDAKRPAFENAMRLHGAPGFRITERGVDGGLVPAGVRAEYFPVTFIEPFLPNGEALGFDLASDKERRATLEKARAMGAPAASAAITLVQETRGEIGVLVVQPVYLRPVALDYATPDPPVLQGYAVAVFRIPDLVESVYGAAYRQDMRLEVLEQDAAAGQRRLYGSEASPEERRPSELQWSTRIGMAGRVWTLRFSPTRRYLAAYRSWAAWTGSAAVPLLSGLLAALLLAMSGRSTRIEALVAQRTAELREANRSLRESEARFRNLADTVPVLIWLADPDGRRTYFNRPWLDLTGRTLEQELDFGWSEQVHPEDREACLEAYGEAVGSRHAFEVEYRIRRRDGSYRWILDRGGPRYTPDGHFAGFIGTAMDVTERRAAQDEVEHLAYHDALTGLPNRRLLLDRLQQAVAQAERRGHVLAVLYADLDHFKIVNDTLGHAAGDALLRQAVVRLEECLRDEDTVARVGGDEFLVVLPSLPSGEAAAPVAQKILAALARPYPVAEGEVRVTVSLGIGVYPGDGADPETLIRNADTALYEAKQAGRNAFRFFSGEGRFA